MGLKREERIERILALARAEYPSAAALEAETEALAWEEGGEGAEERTFRFSPTVERFQWAFQSVPAPAILVVVGPIGAGKSTGAFMGAYLLAEHQEPDPLDNLRKIRVRIVRNHFNDLEKITLPTWRRLFPEDLYGPMTGGSNKPWVHHIRFSPEPVEGGRIEPGLDLHVEFIPFDRVGDVQKFLGWEGTLTIFDEAREFPREIVTAALTRVGRYPPRMNDREGRRVYGVSWFGVYCVTNPDDDEHWLHALRERRAPEEGAGRDPALNIHFFEQPPQVLEVEKVGERWRSLEGGIPLEFAEGEREVIAAAGKHWIVNPAGENLANIDARYYAGQLPLLTLPLIRSFHQAKWVGVERGRRIAPEYRDEFHSREGVAPLPGVPLQGGLDVGGNTLRPAAVLFQIHPGTGQRRVLAELQLFDESTTTYVAQLKDLVSQDARLAALPLGVFWCDPAGNTRMADSMRTAIQALRSAGFDARQAPSPSVSLRIQAIRDRLRLTTAEGEPMLLIDRSCGRLRKCLRTHWVRAPIQGREGHYHDEPIKDDWSHLPDGLGYGLLGVGGMADLRGRRAGPPPRGGPAKGLDYDPHRWGR